MANSLFLPFSNGKDLLNCGCGIKDKFVLTEYKGMFGVEGECWVRPETTIDYSSFLFTWQERMLKLPPINKV